MLIQLVLQPPTRQTHSGAPQGAVRQVVSGLGPCLQDRTGRPKGDDLMEKPLTILCISCLRLILDYEGTCFLRNVPEAGEMQNIDTTAR
jgi:hypothetical protein